MLKNTDYQNARNIIRKGIEEQITFKELRKKLPEWKKIQLQTMIFDEMKNLNLNYTPFVGMFNRPRPTRKQIPVSSDGSINISELLEEIGFDYKKCHAHPYVGKEKISIIVKLDKK